jgi:hypothetical protein
MITLALHWKNDAPAKDGKGEASIPVQPASRHDEFYFTDDMTVFQVCAHHLLIPANPVAYPCGFFFIAQVENRLFRVHRHFLAENSLVFSSMFSPPRGADEAGASDANPIHLSGVTELEFETLVRYFYKR